LSPAAYLADLLAFINNPANIVGTNLETPDSATLISGLNALTMRYAPDDENPGHLKKADPEQARRPDIPAIELSCPNADTPLPYVDLVMEILEQAASGTLEGHSHQTSGDVDQRGAHPEHINETAYDNLAAAVFPLTLPFDIWHAEADLLLPELGTNRVELLETFQPSVGTESGPTDSDRLVLPLTLPFHIRQDNAEQGHPETASLMRSERWARARLGLSAPQWELIAGADEGGVSQSPFAWGHRDGTESGWTSLLAQLSNAEAFLERSGLTYEELMQLTVLKSVDRFGDLYLNPGSPPVCDPAQIEVEGLNQEMALFLHRLLRLRAALGWSLIELDQAVMALDSAARADGQPLLDAQFLIKLAQVVDLKDQFRLPLPELLSWWSNIDTADYSVEGLPVYRSFYDTQVPAPHGDDPKTEKFALDDTRTELIDDEQPLIDYVDLIAPILGLTQSELPLLEDGLALESDRLNLANLSTLYRHASLARALGLGIAEYLLARQLIGSDPFTDEGPEAPTYQTLRFLSRFRDLERSGFGLAELHYLVGAGEHPQGSSLPPTEDWLDQTAESLRQTLSGIEPPSEDEDAALDLQALAALRAKALGIALAELLGIGTDVCRALLTHTRLKADSAPPACCTWAFRPAGLSIMQALLAALGASEPEPHQETVRSILLRLHQAALLVSRLGLTAADLQGLVAIRGRTGWLDPTALPIDPPGPQPLGTLSGLMHLVDFSGLRRRLPAHQRGRLFELFLIPSDIKTANDPAEARNEYTELLAELTGWPTDQIKALIGDPDANDDPAKLGILQPDFPEHFRAPRLALRIGAAIRLAQRLGLPVAEAAALLPDPENAKDSAMRIRNALRARWGANWNAAVKPLRDRLREQQRAALVAFLMHQWSLKRADDLFDLFLIDVEMSPCMQTSRIVQATASVQLFVQRVIMNLEPGLSITADGAAQWEWMKNYRVWEGNRQVFLYPENWIQPELRDDKTPFFEELETELLQSDLTEASAETALLHYLEKLHEIARLQPCGMYREEDS
ncbi:MAG: hypothetical protein LJE61_02930, partial [Thiocapsa sp.]|nr:hypothetical protein [Thiocapsa sp.]